MTADRPWLQIHRGDSPLIVSFPHTGTDMPAELEARFVSPWIARRDADWWVDRLYAFAADLGATMVRTAISRSVIDVNRDPTGASLYPGAATTELCPTTTFDGEPLYRPGQAPDAQEIAARGQRWFAPYHDALAAEIARLRGRHGAVVVYDAHSIRSHIPRLFDGDLPHLNIGTNGGTSCDERLTARVEAACAASPFTHVVNGRFKGGHSTRRHGHPAGGAHAIQMELACRGYMDEPETPLSAANWPAAYDPARAQPMADTLTAVLRACLDAAEHLAEKDRP